MANSSFRLALANDDESIDFTAAAGSSNLEDMFSEFMREPDEKLAVTQSAKPAEVASEPSADQPALTLLAKVVYAYKLYTSRSPTYFCV